MAEEPRASVRWRFRPTLWATVFAAIGILVLIGLGSWQLQRLQWKEALIAERQARVAAEAVPLPAALPDDPAEAAALDYTRVALEGRFLHDKELYLGSRTLDGAVGYHLVTPFRLKDGRGILVDRGWIPIDRRDPATRAEGRSDGEVRLEALLRRGGWRGWTLTRPVNDPDGNLWLWLDLPAMAREAGLERPITTLYAEALPGEQAEGQRGSLPIPVAGQVDLRNDHLQYAITWYALAFALLVIYIVFSSRRNEANAT